MTYPQHRRIMADIKQLLSFSSLCLVLSVCPSVFCQPKGIQQGKQLQACACPPPWTSLLQNHQGALAVLLRGGNNPLCNYIVNNRLLSPCGQGLLSKVCGSREGVQFCCCPYTSNMSLMNSCFPGENPLVNSPGVCVPSDVKPWSLGLYEAFVDTTTLG